jgi:hypothetical protein
VSRNPNITLDIVYANPDKPWDWHGLSENKFEYDDTVFMRRYNESREAYHGELDSSILDCY